MARERPERPERPAKEGQGGVFARFFEGAGAGKRHAFSAGEVVAGRVAKVNEGTFTVDLFGKALGLRRLFRAARDSRAARAAARARSRSWRGRRARRGACSGGLRGSHHDRRGCARCVGSRSGRGSRGRSSGSGRGRTAAPAAEAASAEADADAAAASGEEPAHEESHEEVHEEAEPEGEPPPAPELGSIFRGRVGSVSESGHIAIVNRIIDTQAAKQKIARAREQRKRVRGIVFGFNRGGFDVLVEGIRVFCPASGMSLGPVENPQELLGQRLEFTVPPSKAGTHGFVVSRRGILERLQRKAAKQLFRSLQPGQRLKGRVTQVREFGLFVDLGGIEGLVHQSELSFARGVRPQDAAKPGDEVEVQVLRVGEGQTRRERERVSLSMKALQDDPWGAQADLLEPGSVLTGKVVRTTDFGAFIELAPQIEGLLHISELGRELKHANQVLTDGAGDPRRRGARGPQGSPHLACRSSLRPKKRLSRAAATARARAVLPSPARTSPWSSTRSTPAASSCRSRASSVDAAVASSRTRRWARSAAPITARASRPEPEIPVKAIGVDRDGGFRFSRKALLAEEEKRAVQDYRKEVARQGLGTFGDLLRAKLEGK